MTGHTKKFEIAAFSADFDHCSVDVTVYSSGGVLHSVWTLVLLDNGKTVQKPPVSFAGMTGRRRALEYAKAEPARQNAALTDTLAAAAR